MLLPASAPDYRSAVMRAGPWTVEVVQLRGRDWFPVKLHGDLHGGAPGWWQRGLYATVEQVQEQLAEEFAPPPERVNRKRLT
jgi:hypothetical protein